MITILAARRLSAHSFGIFALGSTLGWMVAVVSDCGIQLHLARAIARRPEAASQLLRGWLRVRVWMAIAAIAIVVTGLTIGWRTTSVAPIAILAIVYACSGLIELLHYFYRGLSRSDVESSLTLWQRGGTLVCGAIALAWKPDVTVLAIAMLLPVLVTLAVKRANRLYASQRAGLPPSPNAKSTARGRSSAATYGRSVPASSCPRCHFRIDVFLVQLWSGTEAVALYNAVFRLVEALRLFPAAVLAVALPSLARAGDLRPLARVAVPVTAVAIAAAAVLWAAAGWLIPLVYGAPYAAACPAFRILLLSFPLLSLNYALTHQLVGWDGQRAYARVCAGALAVNVAINARLIPAWSFEGAAWATLTTESVLTAGCVAALWGLRAAAHTAPLVTEA